MTIPHPLHRASLFLLLLLPSAAIVYGQKVTPKENEEDEAVVLNPFEVKATEDEGYNVTDSNSATKVTMDRRQLPFQISTISSDLIRDLGAINSLEILNLSSSTRPEISVFTGDNNRPYIRGTASTRFYVDGVFYNTTQAPGGVATDRVEVLQGASASLFGQGEPGGTVNYVLKQPLSRVSGSVQTQWGSYGLRRGMLDWGGPLSKNGKFTSRIGLSALETDSNLPFEHNVRKEAFGRLRYTYSPGSYIEFVGNYSQNDLTALAATVTDGAHGMHDPGMRNDIKTKFTSVGLPDPLAIGLTKSDQLLYDRNSFGNIEVKSYTVNWAQRLSEHFVLKATLNSVDSPRVTWRPTYNPYTNVILSPVTYQVDKDNDGIKETTVSYKRGDMVVGGDDQLRSTATESRMGLVNLLTEYKWKHLTWKNVLGVDWTKEIFTDEAYASTWYSTLDPVTEQAKLKPVNNRFRLLAGNVLQPELGLSKPLENTGTYTVPDGKFSNSNDGPGYYMVNIVQLFDDRVTLVGSVRRDEAHAELHQFFQVSKHWVTNQVQDKSKTTYSVGGVFSVNKWFGVFANYATTFKPQVTFLTGPPDITLKPEDRIQPRYQAEPTEGQGGDVGLKIGSPDNKVFLTASAFDVKKQHITQNLLFVVNETDGTQNSYTVNAQTGAQEVKGYSLELTAQPTSGLTMLAGYTALDGKVTDNPGQPSLVGMETTQTPKEKLSATVKYNFQGATMKNWAMGVNLTSYLHHIIYIDAPALTNGVDLRRYYDGATTMDFFVNYRWRLSKKQSIRLQGNLYNFTNTDYSNGGRGVAPGTNFRVSATYSF